VLAFTRFFIDEQKSLARAFMLLKHNRLKFLGVSRNSNHEIVGFVTLEMLEKHFKTKKEIPDRMSVGDFLRNHFR
jgi:hypothetical protein